MNLDVQWVPVEDIDPYDEPEVVAAFYWKLSADWLPFGCKEKHPIPFADSEEWYVWIEGWRPSEGFWGDPDWFGKRLRTRTLDEELAASTPEPSRTSA